MHSPASAILGFHSPSGAPGEPASKLRNSPMTVTTELTALEGSPAVVQSGRPVYRWVILLFAWACYLMSSVCLLYTSSSR